MNMELNFSDSWLRKLPKPEKRLEYRDQATKGLLLRVSPSGVKSFSYYYRIGKRTARVTIGKYPDITLKTARQTADEHRRLLANGNDPRISKLSQRQSLELIVDRMVSLFIEEYAQIRNSSWKQAEANLRLYLVAPYGQFPINEIKRSHIKEILLSLTNRGKYVAANRALAHIRKFFNWLVEEEYLEASPTDHLKKPYNERRRERVLTKVEIQSIWSSLSAIGSPYEDWIKLLFLCGQRRMETALLRRSQIIEDCWHLSGEDTKNKNPNIIPLSTQAQSILEKLLEQKGEYLIKSGRAGDKPINGFSKSKVRLDRISGIKDWTFHDIRRTVSSNLTKMGVDRFLLSRILNHADNAITGVYDQYSYLEEKRHALQQWADRLDDIIS